MNAHPIASFQISRLPRIEFGAGSLEQLPNLITEYGNTVLLVTGQKSFLAGAHWPRLRSSLEQQGIQTRIAQVEGEPSPDWVDATVEQYRHDQIDLVLGIGGGSALDAAKSVAGLLRLDHSVMDFLEGVGPELPYPGPAVPMIACPTTAGTGSEATKNGVLSRHGENGFKKSFRDPQLVPEIAIIDPDLLASCPPSVIAANGMDALTQLLESYVSTRSNPFNNALGASALDGIGEALIAWYQDPDDAHARAHMAYSALVSGINLAQTGLGSVHGLAAPLGAFFPIPHGVVCGSLVAACTRTNIKAMSQREAENPALKAYAQAARLILQSPQLSDTQAHRALVEQLAAWTEDLDLPKLGEWGVSEADIPRIVRHCRGSSMQTNPIVLSDAQVVEILYSRL